ncbi:hypothetical protein BC940DRAFT_313022 [Gongronella butleri]|nr:hypothetical protein BC940DRAFT_313022 [Gongronella butleri]
MDTSGFGFMFLVDVSPLGNLIKNNHALHRVVGPSCDVYSQLWGHWHSSIDKK